MKKNIVERKIMWGDLDALQIVFYPRYYEWFDGCGHMFFDMLGLNMKDLWRERQILFGLVNTSSDYFSPGRYYDDIRITTEIDDLTGKTVRLKHEIEKMSDSTLLVRGYEKRICITSKDPEKLKAADIPPDIYSLLKESMNR